MVLAFTYANSDEEIAKTIAPYFPDTSISDLTKIVKRYRDNDSWFKTTYIEEEAFNHIQDIMESAGELNKRAPYSDLVTNKYSKK